MLYIDQLDQFDDRWTLIPLHTWDATSTRNGKPRKDGKRPLHKDWTTRAYDRAAVLEMARRGHNVGVRLNEHQLVVDVDPRNMPAGRDTFVELCEATGLDPDDFPHVRTGSGGYHYYMRKKPGQVLVDSLEGYEGVEFKSLGRQVVAPGSLHPETGEHYRWESWLVSLDELPPAPPRLLELAARPVRADASDVTAGVHTQQEVADMLDGLDPEEFQDQTRWLELMMACHHASGGMARDEFTEWSTRDPRYQNDAWIIGRRWDSLHANKRSSITVRTLYKALHDRGKANLIPGTAMRPDEFEQELEDAERPAGDDRGILERCNDEWVAATVGGKFRVFHRREQANDGPPVWEALARTDFVARYESRLVTKRTPKGPKRVLLPVEWLAWPKRREAHGVVFKPMLQTPRHLNLWSGWGVEPRPGSWSLLRQLIYETLCDGDQASGDYVVRWLAYMVQKPWLPAETAICFHGAKGTGKSTLGEVLVRMVGAHGMSVTSSEHFTGKFNGHMQDKVFVFADEAVSPTDRDSQEMLKTMITSRTAAYERKGLDIVSGDSCLHVMMASNHDWFLNMSATDGERRYFVSRVSDNRRGDTRFFDALHRQMYEQGGLQALLHDLKVMDLGDWTPRNTIPNTRAMDDQKIQNLEPVQKWWHEVLWEGAMPCEATDESAPGWHDAPVRVFRESLRDAFTSWARNEGIRAGASNRSIAMVFWRELEKVTGPLEEFRDRVPGSSLVTALPDGRAKCVELGTLDEMRARFRAATQTEGDWP